MLHLPNPNGRPNSDVLFPSLNGAQILRRTHETWVIDFGLEENLTLAAQYEGPFDYVREVIFPAREKHRETRQRRFWWLHARPSPRYRKIIARGQRYIVTPQTSKHRLFVWMENPYLADHAILVFGWSHHFNLGVLQGRAHELWSLKRGTRLESRPRYTPSTSFETFAFPRPTEGPWKRFVHDPDERGIGTVRYPRLVAKDDDCAVELKKRTLTNLYNQRPTWLDLAHKELDEAVFAAYGWPPELTDEEILKKLLALNLERAEEERSAQQRLEATS